MSTYVAYLSRGYRITIRDNLMDKTTTKYNRISIIHSQFFDTHTQFKYSSAILIYGGVLLYCVYAVYSRALNNTSNMMAVHRVYYPSFGLLLDCIGHFFFFFRWKPHANAVLNLERRIDENYWFLQYIDTKTSNGFRHFRKFLRWVRGHYEIKQR